MYFLTNDYDNNLMNTILRSLMFRFNCIHLYVLICFKLHTNPISQHLIIKGVNLLERL